MLQVGDLVRIIGQEPSPAYRGRVGQVYDFLQLDKVVYVKVMFPDRRLSIGFRLANVEKV